MIEILATPIIGAIWLISDTIYTFRKITSAIKNANRDVSLIVECEKCKKEHKINIDEWMATWMTKSKKTIKTKMVGVAAVSKANYKYVAKKIYCPECNAKTWSKMENFNEFGSINNKVAFPFALKYLGRGMLLMLICQIIF